MARYQRGGKRDDIVVQRGLLLVVLLVLVDHVQVEGHLLDLVLEQGVTSPLFTILKFVDFEHFLKVEITGTETHLLSEVENLFDSCFALPLASVVVGLAGRRSDRVWGDE